MISDWSVGPPVGRSDHNTVCFDMLLPMRDPKNINVSTRFDFKRADYTNLNNYLLGVDWYSLLTDTCDVNLQWETFTEVLNAGMEMYVPYTTVSVKNNQHYRNYPLYIRQLFRKKCTVWRAYKHFRTTALKNRYKIADQKCTKAVDDFITRKEAELIDQDNLGRFYKYVIE